MPQQQRYYFFYYWFPVIFYCLLLFIQSSFPTPEKLPDLFGQDKVLHFGAYAILGVLFLRAFKNSKFKDRDKFIITMSILLTGLYGISDEVHQYFVPSRMADIWDALFNLLGGVFGVYAYHRLLGKHAEIKDR